MNVTQFTSTLDANRDAPLRIVLPSGDLVPGHFHITEVGQVKKTFIDCGGTRRETAACVLQVWTAHDVEHRLNAGKLAKILKLAEPILGQVDLPVEVEYGADVVSQYVVTGVDIASNGLFIALAGKQTACLAADRCGVGECSNKGCC